MDKRYVKLEIDIAQTLEKKYEINRDVGDDSHPMIWLAADGSGVELRDAIRPLEMLYMHTYTKYVCIYIIHYNPVVSQLLLCFLDLSLKHVLVEHVDFTSRFPPQIWRQSL